MQPGCQLRLDIKRHRAVRRSVCLQVDPLDHNAVGEDRRAVRRDDKRKLDDSNEAIPQPGVRVEVRRELYGDYDGENAQLSGWNDELPMFSGTSDASGVVNIDAPYTVVKDPDNAANDTAYLGNGETNDNDHVVYQRAADGEKYYIRFAIVPAKNSGYELNNVSEKIRNWNNGQNVINVHSSDEYGYIYDDFAFTSGILGGDGQENVGASVEFDLYVKKTASTEEPTTEEPTEETVNINYVSVGPAGASFGSVDSASETVMEKSGTADGSTPTPETGFKFVGWFKDQACTQPVDATWIENNKIIPQKTTEAYEAATYYAKFEYDVADLTINKQGWQAIDENQSFIFDVTGPNGYYKRVVIQGSGSVTIKGLKVGTYSVTEVTDWSWRYKTADGTANSIEHEIKPKDGFVFDFTNSRENGKWLGGDAYSKNVFGTIIETDSGN